MSDPGVDLPCPLLRYSVDELNYSLRGFPDCAVSGVLALREAFTPENLEVALFGIFLFYLPRGTEAPEWEPSKTVRLREDLGLDSLSLAEAMFKIEELFAIRIQNAEIADVTTLADASGLLFAKLKREASSGTDE